jgi:crotonobetainyl-CoA:carnitine CoA-transferase CaiB-like acyl-CoA transferase
MSPALPLGGLRILDLGWAMAGPQATRLLADFGAEVIKVESRARPDQARTMFPPHVGERSLNSSGYFNNFNRNKLGVTINLSLPEGRKVMEKLIAISDGLLENYSARVMSNWGWDYDGLCLIKPDIVYVSMAGFGHDGPYVDYQSYGPTVQALSGLTHISGLPDREPSGWGFSYMDHTSGYLGAIAMMQALFHRRRTGEGQYVDMSQVEAAVTLTGTAILDFTVNGRPSTRQGNRSSHPAMAPHGVYRCAPNPAFGDDEWLAIAVEDETQWEAFARALGRPDWLADERFATLLARLEHQDELDCLISGWTLERTNSEAMRTLQEAGVPAGRVQRSRELFDDDPQLAHRGLYPRVAHPVVGEHRIDGMPPLMSRSAPEFRRGGPLIGQDNELVFTGLLGMDPEEVALLEEAKVLW